VPYCQKYTPTDCFFGENEERRANIKFQFFSFLLIELEKAWKI